MEKTQDRRTIPTRLTPDDIKAMKAAALEMGTTSIDIATLAVRFLTQDDAGRRLLEKIVASQKKEKKDSLPS